jgi:hypothetical protein
MRVSAKTQQRLVQRQSFATSPLQEEVEEVSIDGGTVRLIVEPGEEPRWKQYKAIHLSPEKLHGAWLDDNGALLEWLNEQPLSAVVTCLGDGHDGIWNLFEQVRGEVERREILDWYHLMENLEKVGGSLKRCLRTVKSTKLTVSVSTYESIIIALSTMIICKRRAFAQLVLEPLNQRSNKLIGDSKFQGHDGSQNMCQRF